MHILHFTSLALAVAAPPPLVTWFTPPNFSVGPNQPSVNFLSNDTQPISLFRGPGDKLVILGTYDPGTKLGEAWGTDQLAESKTINNFIYISDNDGNIWLRKPVPSKAVRSVAATAVLRAPSGVELLCLVGGKVFDGARWLATRSVLCTSDEGDTWQEQAPLNTSVLGGTMVQAPSGTLLIGGQLAGGLYEIVDNTEWGKLAPDWAGVVLAEWGPGDTIECWRVLTADSPLGARTYPAVTWSRRHKALYITGGFFHSASSVPDGEVIMFDGTTVPQKLALYHVAGGDVANRSAWSVIGQIPHGHSAFLESAPEMMLFEVLSWATGHWTFYPDRYDYDLQLALARDGLADEPPMSVLVFFSRGHIMATTTYGLPGSSLYAVLFATKMPYIFPSVFYTAGSGEVARLPAVFVSHVGRGSGLVTMAGVSTRATGNNLPPGQLMIGYWSVTCADPCARLAVGMYSSGCLYSAYDAVCLPCDLPSAPRCEAGSEYVKAQCGTKRNVYTHFTPVQCAPCTACDPWMFVLSQCSGGNDTVCGAAPLPSALPLPRGSDRGFGAITVSFEAGAANFIITAVAILMIGTALLLRTLRASSAPVDGRNRTWYAAVAARMATATKESGPVLVYVSFAWSLVSLAVYVTMCAGLISYGYVPAAVAALVYLAGWHVTCSLGLAPVDRQVRAREVLQAERSLVVKAATAVLLATSSGLHPRTTLLRLFVVSDAASRAEAQAEDPTISPTHQTKGKPEAGKASPQGAKGKGRGVTEQDIAAARILQVRWWASVAMFALDGACSVGSFGLSIVADYSVDEPGVDAAGARLASVSGGLASFLGFVSFLFTVLVLGTAYKRSVLLRLAARHWHARGGAGEIVTVTTSVLPDKRPTRAQRAKAAASVPAPVVPRPAAETEAGAGPDPRPDDPQQPLARGAGAAVDPMPQLPAHAVVSSTAAVPPPSSVMLVQHQPFAVRPPVLWPMGPPAAGAGGGGVAVPPAFPGFATGQFMTQTLAWPPPLPHMAAGPGLAVPPAPLAWPPPAVPLPPMWPGHVMASVSLPEHAAAPVASTVLAEVGVAEQGTAAVTAQLRAIKAPGPATPALARGRSQSGTSEASHGSATAQPRASVRSDTAAAGFGKQPKAVAASPSLYSAAPYMASPKPVCPTVPARPGGKAAVSPPSSPNPNSAKTSPTASAGGFVSYRPAR